MAAVVPGAKGGAGGATGAEASAGAPAAAGGASSSPAPAGRRKKKGAKGGGSSSKASRKDYRSYLQLSLHHMRHSVDVFAPAKAVALMKQCVAIRKDPRTLFALSMAALLDNDLKGAVDGFAPDTGIDSNARLRVKASFMRAIAFARQDQLVKAERGMLKAIKEDPKCEEAHGARGILLSLMGKSDEALEAFGAGLAELPESAVLYSLRGVEHGQRGDVTQAEADFTKARSADTSRALPFYFMALCQEHQGRDSIAIKSYERLLGAMPDYVPGHVRLALLFARQNRLDEAMPPADAACKYGPDAPSAFLARSCIHTLRGEHDDALSDASTAYELLPSPSLSGSSAKDPPVPLMGKGPRKWMGIGGAQRGATRDPLCLTPTVKLSAIRCDVAWLVLRCALAAEAWEAAKAAATEVIAVDDSSAEVLVIRSICNQKLGKLGAAMADASAAVDHDVDNAAALEQQSVMIDEMLRQP